jgi:hypothetical protein
MKYCLHYTNALHNWKDADEISILYEGQNPFWVLGFAQEHKDKRVILRTPNIKRFIENDEGRGLLNLVGQCEFAIAFDEPRSAFTEGIDEYIVEYLNSFPTLKFFFNHTIKDMETLEKYLQIGVSDVFVGEKLGFMLPAVKALCSDCGVTIRTFPNVAQISIAEPPARPLTSFYIRPNDVRHYEKYIDVFEFWGSLDRQATYLDIYKSGQWIGPMFEYIIGYNDPEAPRNECILPSFAIIRSNCKQECLSGGRCDNCDVLADISHKLHNQNLYIKDIKKH